MTHQPAHLTDTEVREVTGKRTPAAQAAWLARQGIPFQFAGRQVLVDRRVAEAHRALPEPAETAGVDWSAVR